MTTPRFLDLDHVIRLHRSLIEHYGGIEGIRDVGLLDSAVAQPRASFGGEFGLAKYRRPNTFASSTPVALTGVLCELSL